MGRYLVIGAAGLVGSHLMVALRDREAVGTHHREPVPGGIPLDVTDAAAVRALVRDVRPDAILLAAADAYVERCEHEPAGTRRVNVDGARHVATAAAEAGAALVVFSSEYVFDGAHGEYSEDDAVAPLNEYGRQKVEVESIARTVSRHLVCRISGVFGAEPSRKNFVFQLADALRAGRTFRVPSDQTITPTYAPSVAAAVVGLLDRGISGTIHAAGPERLSRDDFARRAARAFGLPETLITPVATSELGLAAPRPLRAGLRDDRLRAALGHGLTPVDTALNELAKEAGA